MIGSDPSGIGQRFVEFALGRSDTFPVDTPVRLYLGNAYRRTRTLTSEQALDPRSLNPDRGADLHKRRMMPR